MLKILLSGLAGLLFGLGLVVSMMVNPAKVLAFLDVAGAWDPSLALVMAGALAVTAAGYRWVLRQPQPWLSESFSLPTRREIDVPLIGGAALFGLGWGLSGFCPGPAVVAMVLAPGGAVPFVAAMLAGMALAEGLQRLRPAGA
jgi:uncharacterized membrane protein YedE/YeeE